MTESLWWQTAKRLFRIADRLTIAAEGCSRRAWRAQERARVRSERAWGGRAWTGTDDIPF